MGIVGFTNVVLHNNIFLNNEAYYGGGIAIISVGNIYFEGLTMINSNSKVEGGEIYIVDTIIAHIFNSDFYNSSSESNAGCFYSRNVNEIYFKNVTVHNSSTYDKGGTAYFLQIKNLILEQFIINNSSAYKGGMFYFYEKTNVLINNCQFKSGYSLSLGGFAFLDGYDLNITILSSFFYEFLSEKDAAVIFVSNIVNLTIFHSEFSSSTTKNHGLGIIYLNVFSEGKERFFNLYNVSFSKNSATYGANIYS